MAKPTKPDQSAVSCDDPADGHAMAAQRNAAGTTAAQQKFRHAMGKPTRS